MCRLRTDWDDESLQCPALYDGLERMKEMEKDGLFERGANSLKVTDKGQPFVRNICLTLDARYWEKQPEENIFSQVV